MNICDPQESEANLSREYVGRIDIKSPRAKEITKNPPNPNIEKTTANSSPTKNTSPAKT